MSEGRYISAVNDIQTLGSLSKGHKDRAAVHVMMVMNLGCDFIPAGI